VEQSKLVIVTKSILEIGKKYQGLTTGPWHEPRPEQPYQVVANATEEDWVDCLTSFQGESTKEWHEIVASIGGPWNYYEIKTD